MKGLQEIECVRGCGQTMSVLYRPVRVRGELTRHVPVRAFCHGQCGNIEVGEVSDVYRELLADEHAALERRETKVAAREEALTRRRDAAGEILADADTRDADADARDVAADEREHAHDKKAFTDPESGHDSHWPERRNAGMDRAQAHDDRAASLDDRLALTEAQDDTEAARDE